MAPSPESTGHWNGPRDQPQNWQSILKREQQPGKENQQWRKAEWDSKGVCMKFIIQRRNVKGKHYILSVPS